MLHYKKQMGFMMLEVLISLVVITVGLISLSGLQIASLRVTNEAHLRNTASLFIMDFSERMRANPVGISEGHYGSDVSCSVEEVKCRDNYACSPEETAKFDIQEVMCGIRHQGVSEGGIVNLLPQGTFNVSCELGCDQPDVRHDIFISWNASNTHKDQAIEQTQVLQISVVP